VTDTPPNPTRQHRTPGIPGILSDIQWVDSPEFGDEPEQRRIPTLHDVNPAPLARVLAVMLELTGDDLGNRMRELADDDRDGPIHLVHLLAACEYAARMTGGGLPGGPRSGGGDPATMLLTATVSGQGVPALVAAMHEGGFPAATRLAREMNAEERRLVLDSLLSYWMAPITALMMDLTINSVRGRRHS
jgi:hypothetical protein